eukprot:jgi/Hompol1/1382/HPOL_002306-RA
MMCKTHKAKAQETRDSLMSLRAEKLRTKTEKIQAVRERKLEESRQLKESIEEKQVKAEKLRESHLNSIKNKAKDEDSKRDEITFITTLRYFVDPSLRCILLPTLVILTASDMANRAILKEDVSVDVLKLFLQRVGLGIRLTPKLLIPAIYQ